MQSSLSDTVIQFKDVSAAVDSKEILSGISLTVPAGGKVVLIGKSGAGKSSILHAFLGLLVPTEGEIFFYKDKLDPSSVDHIRSSVAYIGQEPVLGGASTVREALMLPFTFQANRKARPDDETVKQTLSLLELSTSILDSRTDVISGGEKQRIVICRGLLLKKRVFLLDEATSALDKESARAVTSLLSQDHFTYLSVSHHDEWIAGCDTVIELDGGKITSVQRGSVWKPSI